ncbi:hypothetical protein [Salibacterium halotolerans]|uniref:Uncharacterized protein n=1 Tax=Salibacterium halotolerans TaxID=1884432 RepID=A0A1I5S792_9BACI|nr:hypothetical protein [Salibacterium halotolerans]SFP66615.1 hypothetical protein SAMN05518683_10877 [Salibacterium halotolerans]
MYAVFAVGLLLGVLLFSFILIPAGKSAPLVTVAVSVVIVLYGLLVVRGFAAMGYIFLAAGFLFTGIAGSMVLPLITKKGSGRYTKADKTGLIVIPAAFILTSILFFR